jgi:hypothetical protein
MVRNERLSDQLDAKHNVVLPSARFKPLLRLLRLGAF